VPTATRDAVTKAARREGLTVGQWLERRVNEWEGAGSPVVTVSGQAPINLGDLAQAMESARKLANDAKVEVPPQLAKDGLSLIRQAMRHAKGGLPRPASRKPPQAAVLALEGKADTTSHVACAAERNRKAA
jgi:hypothetical protein